MTSAKGSFDFLSSECVVGIALRVDRTYLAGQFAKGEGVTLVYPGISERTGKSHGYLHWAAE